VKRYWLFGGVAGQSPLGGFLDYKGSFDVIDDAKTWATFGRGLLWWHLVDSQTGEVVADGA
jgi:hypothetical protein